MFWQSPRLQRLRQWRILPICRMADGCEIAADNARHQAWIFLALLRYFSMSARLKSQLGTFQHRALYDQVDVMKDAREGSPTIIIGLKDGCFLDARAKNSQKDGLEPFNGHSRLFLVKNCTLDALLTPIGH